MSYAPRGPGRSRQYPTDQNGGSGSVRAARDRLAREQERRQRSSRIQDIRPPPPAEVPPPQSLSPRSQYALNSTQVEQSLPWPSRRDMTPPIHRQMTPPIHREMTPPIHREMTPPIRREMTPPNYGDVTPPVRRERSPLQGIGKPPQSPPPSVPEIVSQDTGLSYLDRQGRAIPPQQAQLSVSALEDSARRLKTFSQSSNTSLGPIPDFPVPVNSNLQASQPSPNTRRGFSSYYSQLSNNVAPIREEAGSRESIRSYASSTVIPTARSRVPDFYYEDADPSDGNSSPQRVSPVPVRTASIGRRGKPSVMAIRSSKGKDNREFKEVLPSSSEEALVEKEVVTDMNFGLLNPAASRSSKQLDAYLKDLEKEVRRVSMLKQAHRSALLERRGSRIPSPLNADSAHDSRGSLTSLPELIRRATKLAANLDRGKTASRLGLEWMGKDTSDMAFNEMGDMERETEKIDIDDSMQTGTTLRDPTPRDEWRPPRSEVSRKSKSKSREKRWCGMKPKHFVWTMVILFILIAAAVVVPIVLILLPKLHHAKSAASNDGSCASTVVCQNGGVSTTLPGGTCICLCSDAYSGFLCQNAPEPACTTINDGKIGQATVGTLIPPLIEDANANFSIPLAEEVLLTRFAEFNLTCPVSNALVTFPSVPSKRSIESTLIDDLLRRDALIVARQDTNGAPGAAAPTTTATTAAGSAATGTAVVTVDTLTGATNSSTINFARVGILFVLQDSDSITATQMAQQNIYSFLVNASQNETTVAQAQNITLGNGYVLDLWHWTIKLKNGTVYGNHWNGTATSGSLT